ncbi:hypothetical protein N8342_10440 [Acidimicrobiales bacterium]|nr:hypothetical protein [Acidimicrobiales bacterium]
MLAIPATLFGIVSVAGLLLDPDTVTQQVEDNLSGLPEEAQTIISEQLESVSGGSTGGLILGLIVGLLLANRASAQGNGLLEIAPKWDRIVRFPPPAITELIR